MNYSLPGGGTLFMGIPATESQLERLIKQAIEAARKKLEALCTALNKDH